MSLRHFIMAQARYITVAEFAEAYDSRVLAQLSSDAGSVATVDENNTILLNVIERASADVQAFALRGGRYSADDLDALATADDWILKGTVASLAISRLYQRRGGDAPSDVKNDADAASRLMKDLADGARVFNDSDAIAAGKPEIKVVNRATRGRLGLVGDQPFFPASKAQIV